MRLILQYTAISGHEVSVQVDTDVRRPRSALVKVGFQSQEMVRESIWSLELRQESVDYGNFVPDSDSSKEPIGEEGVVSKFREMMAVNGRSINDSVDAEKFLSEATARAYSVKDGSDVYDASIEYTGFSAEIVIRKSAVRICELSLCFDEFTSNFPRAELKGNWNVEAFKDKD